MEWDALLPGEQRVEVVGGRRVWAEGWRRHIGSGLGPVLAPIV